MRDLNPVFILPLLAARLISAEAAMQIEDFASNPLAKGWRIFGDSSLFHWNGTNQNLEVTWDSRRPNSYFYLPLDFALTAADDFTMGWDIFFTDIVAGIDPDKESTFEIAFGASNLASSTDPEFWRGSGIDTVHGPRDLVEFAYFPDSISGFGATVAPTIASTNNQIVFSDNHPLELTVGQWFHVVMQYTSTNRTLHSSLSMTGSVKVSLRELTLGDPFTDFNLDIIGINSYSDAGQSPPQFAGSVLAHGIIDNVQIDISEPVGHVSGRFENGLWLVDLASRKNWFYTLERSIDLRNWSALGSAVSGTGGTVTFRDSNTSTPIAFYRVRADR